MSTLQQKVEAMAKWALVTSHRITLFFLLPMDIQDREVGYTYLHHES
jgi:hypothetical protein